LLVDAPAVAERLTGGADARPVRADVARDADMAAPPAVGPVTRDVEARAVADLPSARALTAAGRAALARGAGAAARTAVGGVALQDRKSTRLNSSHLGISY